MRNKVRDNHIKPPLPMLHFRFLEHLDLAIRNSQEKKSTPSFIEGGYYLPEHVLQGEITNFRFIGGRF